MGGDVTGLLERWRQGDRGALDALLPLVFAELHRIAARQLHGEREGHTLRPTDLVAEAYLRLVGAPLHAKDRVHFYALAANTMRQVLVDHARRRGAKKRGGGERPVTLPDALADAPDLDALLAIDEAVSALAKVDERKARVLELAHFAELTQPEIAALLGVHVNTVARDLRLAEAWVARYLEGEP